MKLTKEQIRDFIIQKKSHTTPFVSIITFYYLWILPYKDTSLSEQITDEEE